MNLSTGSRNFCAIRFGPLRLFDLGAAADADQRRKWSNISDWSETAGCTDLRTNEVFFAGLGTLGRWTILGVRELCFRRFLRILESVGGSEGGVLLSIFRPDSAGGGPALSHFL